MPASLVATYTFVNPVIALLLGWLVLKGQLTVRTAIGAASVISSVVTLQFSKAHIETRQKKECAVNGRAQKTK